MQLQKYFILERFEVNVCRFCNHCLSYLLSKVVTVTSEQTFMGLSTNDMDKLTSKKDVFYVKNDLFACFSKIVLIGVIVVTSSTKNFYA